MKENPLKHGMANEAQEERVTTIGLTSEAPADSKLREFFLEELRDIYWAEQHLLATLPKMEGAATTEKLKAAFADHLVVTQKHVARLQDAFKLLGEQAQGKKCEAIAGITTEGEEIIAETEAGSVTRDVGLIMAAQKVEHYEIATYGTLKAWAHTLGKHDAAQVLQEILDEEYLADKTLTGIAESHLNREASS